MQRLEVSGAVRPIYELLGVKRLKMIGYSLIRSSFPVCVGAVMAVCKSIRPSI